MFQKNEKYRTTLSRELICVIAAALVGVVLIYFILSTLFGSFLDSHFTTDEYYQSEDAKIISSLESYIEEYNVSSWDWYILNEWVDANPVSYITIYKDGRLAYLSDQSSQKERSQLEYETNYEQSVAYKVKFADGLCDVIISGNYAEFYYNAASFLKFSLPFIFFILVLLGVVKRKVKYVVRLDQDVELLKKGAYEHPIRIEGRDELTTLAESINEMREAYNQKIDEINRLSDDNRAFVTEMSHDMRTPMTPLLVYLGMLRDGRYETQEEHDSYVLKANEKAVQLKHMSDHMFNSLLVNQGAEVELTVTGMNVAFYDQMSALADYLGAEGFQIDARDVHPSDACVLVNMDFLARIFNNIMSNILKYANHEEPLRLYMDVDDGTESGEGHSSEMSGSDDRTDEKYVVVRFANAINELADYSSSTGFGVKNIRKMMAQMNAECVIDQQPETYEIELRFPVVEREDPAVEAEEAEKPLKNVEPPEAGLDSDAVSITGAEEERSADAAAQDESKSGSQPAPGNPSDSPEGGSED